ncbi:MAG: hypothetical protein V9H26_00825 [Verrucomicrobiota bacterium]
MINQLFKRRNPWLLVCGLGLFATGSVQAQFPGGFGGFGGQNQNRNSSSTSARQYNPAGTVGTATISVDPETRQLIVITDEDTNFQIGQVVTNLDRPKPQVLIKVVFVEVTHTDGSDIGVEGGFTGTDKGVTGNAADVFGLSGLNQIATNVQRNALGQPVQSFIPTPPGAGSVSNRGAGLSSHPAGHCDVRESQDIYRAPPFWPATTSPRPFSSASRCR